MASLNAPTPGKITLSEDNFTSLSVVIIESKPK
jgi:hypothetical protein